MNLTNRYQLMFTILFLNFLTLVRHVFFQKNFKCFSRCDNLDRGADVILCQNSKTNFFCAKCSELQWNPNQKDEKISLDKNNQEATFEDSGFVICNQGFTEGKNVWILKFNGISKHDSERYNRFSFVCLLAFAPCGEKRFERFLT